RVYVSLDLLIGDAWSWGILFREWARLYHDPEAKLPELQISFRDYVLTQAQLRQSRLYRRSRNYWLGRLDQLPPGPDLPLARQPSEIERPRFVSLSHHLERSRWQRLQKRATAAGLTASGLLLAVFAEVIATWSKSPRFTINITLFQRLALHPQVRDLIGDFTSLTLLAVDHRPRETFVERARRLQQQFWDDLDHRFFSGVEVLRELARGEGGPSRAAMPVVFTSTLHMTAPGAPSAEETRARDGAGIGEVVYTIGQTPQVWLDFQVGERHGELGLLWEAVEGLFPEDFLDDVFGAYCRLLASLADDEALWNQAALDLLPSRQRELLTAYNATAAPLPEGLLHAGFEAQAACRPEHPAVIAAERTLDYGELERLANGLAHELRELGARPDQLVAVVMEKGWQQVVAVLAILKAGAAYLPVDATLPAERRQVLLAEGEVTIALTQARLDAALEWPAEVRRLVVDRAQPAPAAAPPPPVQTPTDLAYVIFTSGSTGKPKGVMIDHRGALNTVVDVNQRFAVGPEDRVLGLSSLSFDLSVYDVFGVLAAGGAVVLPETSAARDPGRWLELLQQHRVTLWNTVPALLVMLLEYLEGSADSSLPPSLREVLLSGDWIPVNLPERLRQAAPRAKLTSLGGATEASIWSILYPVTAVDPQWTSIPYGRPMRNQTFHVVDEALEPRPIGVPGQLAIGGVGVARGYWRDDDKTRAHFVTQPRTGDGLYLTGDLGQMLPDGVIEFLGREDNQVKVRGHRIELGEIEAHLARHDEVTAAVVEARGPKRGDKQLVAYVVPENRDSGSPRAGEPRTSDPDAGGAQRPALINPLERLEFKLKKPGLRPLGEAPAVALSRPEAAPAELEALFLERRSHRHFLPEPVSIKDLSAWLSCLMAVEIEGSPFPKYRYGSAGNLYAVQTCLQFQARRISGLAGGTYYYHPLEHRLVTLRAGAEIDPAVHPPGNREIFERAAFSVFLIADLAAVTPLYGEIGRHFVTLEAGLMSQLLETAAPLSGLGLCQLGSLDFAPLRPLFDLGPQHLLLHSLVGGAVDSATDPRDGYLREVADEARLVEDLVASRKLMPGAPYPAGRFEAAGFARSAAGLGERLRAFLAEALPDYMIPSSFVLLDELPLTANGKVDRSALTRHERGLPPELSSSDRPSREAVPPEGRLIAPSSRLERTVATVWQEVLDIESVGLEDNFFDLGGHSITMVRAYNRIKETLDRDFPLVVMFDRPTVGSLAAYLAEETGDRASVARGQERGHQRTQAARRRQAARRTRPRRRGQDG
ncbi:MAG: amino acid adenylation domain-containing protein, partial [Thermoanaerobaculia bacterium]